MANMFLSVCRSRAIFCQMGEMLSVWCRSQVIIATPTKCCHVVEKLSLSWPRRKNVPHCVLRKILSGSHGANASPVLQNKCDLANAAKMSPVSVKTKLIWTTWQKSSYKIKVFSPHGTNVPLVFRNKYDFGRTAEVLYTDFKTQSARCIWHLYSRHVDINCKYSPDVPCRKAV